MKKQHPQLGFIFITSLEVVLPMIELHYVICVNKHRKDGVIDQGK